MAARSRISSSVPAWMPSSSLREASLTRSSKRLRPGRLVLHHLGRRQRVGPAREVLALVEIGMARRRQIAAVAEVDRAVGRLEGVGMHRLVGEEQRERLVALLAQELDGMGVQEIGDVAFVLAFIAVDVEHRIDDRAVAGEAHPAVVARPRPARIAHVPLADMGGLVAQPLQDDVIVGQAMAVRVARHVVDDAVPAGVLAGDDRGAVGRAERRGVERRGEHRAFVADAVDVRRLHVGMAADAQLVEPEIVDQDDQEIGFALSCQDGFPPLRARSTPRAETTLAAGLDGRQRPAPHIAGRLFRERQ